MRVRLAQTATGPGSLKPREHPVLYRLAAVVLVAAVAWAIASYVGRPQPARFSGGPAMDDMARRIGTPVMRHLFRGHVPGRSGEIMLVPKPHRYIIGSWDLRTLGSDEPETFVSHPNPWDYLARVPLVFYGPPFAPSGREVRRAVDLASVAPTYARLLGLEGFEAEGAPLAEIASPQPPAVVVTVVLDGGGWNVLREHPDSWPMLESLARHGTSYLNATIGSAPSLTGPVHSTLGTGNYPVTHGIPSNPWLSISDPATLRVPAVSELWDETTGNAAVVAMTGFEDPHVGMIGHGAQRSSGDHDVAVFWSREPATWRSDSRYYELPDYLLPTDLERLESYEEGLDERDGVGDGLWFGHDVEELREPLIRPGTPAFARFNGDAVIQIIRNEAIGSDDVTDLVWVEMKMPDWAGHSWNMVRPEQGDVLAEVDAQIARVVRELDRTVGTGDYLLAVTADHGQEPLPEVSGGWRINSRELEGDIEERFGPVVTKVTTLDLRMDMSRVAEEDVALEDIARFVATYTIGDNIPEGAPGANQVPGARLDERLFAGAFTTTFLQSLTPRDIAGYGRGVYPEGDFPTVP